MWGVDDEIRADIKRDKQQAFSECSKSKYTFGESGRSGKQGY